MEYVIAGDAPSGPRRSGRVRKAVEHYADLEPPQKAPKPGRKRKRSSTIESTAKDGTDGIKVKKPVAKEVKKSALGKPSQTKKVASQSKAKTDETHLRSFSYKTANAQNVETRLKAFYEEAPDQYEATMYRATKQRMVVIDRVRRNNHNCPHSTPDCPMEVVDVAGTTGNIYNVQITHVSNCTCPDFRIRKNPQCKHILYVLIKVLKVREDLRYQAAFLTEELREIFEHAGPLPTEIASAAHDKDGKRKPVEGDCPICCEEMSEDAEAIVWCKAACGNNLHKSCFDQWAATKSHLVTCPYCRTEWQDESVRDATLSGISKVGTKNTDGYVNVASQLGMSTKRDTAIYRQQAKMKGGWYHEEH